MRINDSPDAARIGVRRSRRTLPRRSLLRGAAACGLGMATALLASCGSSGKGLIPAADAGPLRSDFEAVAADAQAGDGSCSATEAALLQTEHDFAALPASLDAGLRRRLQEGIVNLNRIARERCAQPHAETAATGTPSTTTTSTQAPTTTPTVTQTSTTQTTPTTAPTTTPTTTPGTGGGTPAPSQNESGSGQGGNTNSGAGAHGKSESNGAGGGEAGGGAGLGGKEGGK